MNPINYALPNKGIPPSYPVSVQQGVRIRGIRQGICLKIWSTHLLQQMLHPEVYILIIPGFGIISTTISASSNKSVFGHNGSLIVLLQLTQQTICRELMNASFKKEHWMNDISNSLLFNTKNISNTMYSFLVRIFIILISNPQITKTQSENFKSKIQIMNFWLCMLVEISEAIRLLPTFFFIKICKNFPNTIDKHYLTAAAAAAAAFTKAYCKDLISSSKNINNYGNIKSNHTSGMGEGLIKPQTQIPG